jgi:SAM-dependent methyltransferase
VAGASSNPGLQRESADGSAGMLGEFIEIRHVPGSTRSAYEAIYSGPGMRQPDYVWDTMLDLLELEPGMRLLDVAGGEGGLARRARERGVDAQAVDLAGTAMLVARRSGVPATVGNGESLPFATGTFDRIVNFGSLEHYLDPVRGVMEMRRVLAPDALALIQVPNTFGLRWSVMHAWRHGEVADDGQPVQRYGTRRGWTRLLHAGGLNVRAVLAFEDLRLAPRGVHGWFGALVHPSRLLIPLSTRLPVDMASMFVFLCTPDSNWQPG